MVFIQLGVCLAILIKGIIYPIDLGWVSVSKTNQCLVLQLDDFAKVRSNANWPSVCFNPFLMWDTIRHFIHLSGGAVHTFYLGFVPDTLRQTLDSYGPNNILSTPLCIQTTAWKEAKPPGWAKKKVIILFWITWKITLKKGWGGGPSPLKFLHKAACVNMKPNFSALLLTANFAAKVSSIWEQHLHKPHRQCRDHQDPFQENSLAHVQSQKNLPPHL